VVEKMKRINKNKRGQFFSIGIFLLIVVLALIFSYSAIYREKNNEFHVQRLKTAVMSSFVDEFEKEYAYKILETAAKPSLVMYFDDYSAPISFEDFTMIMKTGELNGHSFPELTSLSTDSTLKKILSIVTFNAGVEGEFEYTLEKAQMISPDEMKLSFIVSYEFKSGTSTWSNEDVEIDLTIRVYSLNHPVYRQIINDYWMQDTSTCLATQVFIEGDNCLLNMKPFEVTPT
jgi:hypothetical protein